MPKKLSKLDEAYNAAIDALNEAEDRLEEALRDRDRAWDAAQSIAPLGAHGARHTTSGARDAGTL